MRVSFMLGVFTALVVAACGQGSGPPVGPGPILAQTVINITNGDNQVDTVIRRLNQPIVARALDSLSLVPQKGVVVSWVVVSGGGTVFAPTTQTGDSGFTRQLWTLGETAGPQLLEARGIDPNTGQPFTFVQVHATALPGRAFYAGFTARFLTAVGDSNLALPMRVQDRFGNAITNYPVTGLDGRVPDSTGHWVAYPAGVTRFRISGPNETDTLTVLVSPPSGQPYTATDSVTESGWLWRQTAYDSSEAGSCGVTAFVSTYTTGTQAGLTPPPLGPLKLISGASGGRFTMQLRTAADAYNCHTLRQDTLAGRWVFKMDNGGVLRVGP